VTPSAVRILNLIVGRVPFVLYATLSREKLISTVKGFAPDPAAWRFHASRNLGIPEDIVDALRERGLFGGDTT
jgi:hypothetical protein